MTTIPNPVSPVPPVHPLLDAFRAATDNLAARVVAHNKAIIAAGQMTPAQAEEGSAIVSTLYALAVSATNPIPDPMVTKVTPATIENVPPIPPDTFVSPVSPVASSSPDFGPFEVVRGGTLDVDVSEGLLSRSIAPKGTDELPAVPLTVSTLNGPAHSAGFVLNPDGSFHYIHDGSDSTSDSFTYHTNDDLQTDPVRTVNISIVAIAVVEKSSKKAGK
jgi:hypothetical protein